MVARDHRAHTSYKYASSLSHIGTIPPGIHDYYEGTGRHGMGSLLDTSVHD